MKKFVYALLAIAATLSLASCNEDFKEENGNESPVLGDNAISFKLAGTIDTRSETGAPASVKGVTIPLGDPVDGQQIYLEETVTSLDDIYFGVPETKGTPVYTDNFSKVSGGVFKGLAFPVGTLDDVRPTTSNVAFADGDFSDLGDRWLREFPSDPWGGNDALIFFARMLTEATGTADANTRGVIPGSYRYFYTADGVQSLTFSYRSASTAQEQQDILFAGRTIAKADAGTPFPLLFNHALTGVKFATAHANGGGVKTYIKKVELTGLYGYGKCTVTLQSENGYVDDPTNYSSENAISWALSENNPNANLSTVYSQEFDDDYVDYASDGSFSTMGNYPSSFSAAGNQKNLNDADGTMTFWFPPQTLSDATKLTVTFEIEIGSERTEYTRVIDFGTLLKGTGTTSVTWKAGQLRTYTLKAEQVDVTIDDEVDGFLKDNVVITNTGNVDAFIRAHIVANWWGKTVNGDDGLALGYLGDDNAPADPIEYVTAWKMVGTSGDNYGGIFTKLADSESGWVRANDGYFYYTEPVAPGDPTGTLFESYELVTSNPVPVIWYLSTTQGLKKFTDVRLVMDIPVQAIEAKDYTDFKAAWAAAGVTVVTE